MSKNNYLHVPMKKQRESKICRDHWYKVLMFFQLKAGDEFSFNKKKYTKINDDFGQTKKGVKKHFWPQETVQLPKKMKLKELNESYPITQYEY